MNLLFKVLKKIKYTFFHRAQATIPLYPYLFLEKKEGVEFNINNSIEEFRLRNWGGERDYVENMLKELAEDDILFDIGSSVGLISVLAAKKLTKGKVISFEPDPENAQKLKKNYQVNKLNNFSIQQLAVGENAGSMELYTAGSNAFSPSLKKVNGIDNSIIVKIDSIDNLIKKNEIPYPTVVKIDIEGAEMMALKGMKKLLESDKSPRLLFIELHPDFLTSFGTSTEEIYNFLSQLNYTIVEDIVREKQILCKLIKN